ncbi:putative ribonuclease H-like domain-containing protein, partial [Tanacetum coccineum]
FLYGKIKEEVYVCQPSGFEDPDFLDRVYKVEKALYGLHQNPRAWYETLSTYLLENGFQRGKIDKTLFIRRDKGDILLVQVYVDDIIFGSTKKSLCTEFEKMVHKKFQMSSMGELTFFLGLHVKQKENGIFINQDKYVTDILKKFGFTDVKTASTPMKTQKPLLKDEDGEEVDVHLYRSMIGSLMYLTSSRPDIIYLKGLPKLGLWYPKDLSFDLVAYTDSDYDGASLDKKSTIGGCQFLGCRLISWQCKKQTVVANSTTEAEIGVNAGDSKLMLLATESYGLVERVGWELVSDSDIWILCSKLLRHNFTADARRNVNDDRHNILRLVKGESTQKKLDGVDCLPNATIFEQLTLMSMVKNLDSAVKFLMYPRFVQVFLNNQLEGMATHNRIFIAPSHTKKVFANMKRQGKNFYSRVTPLFPTMVVQAQQEQDEAINKKNGSKHSNDPLLSGEDRLKLEELMALCTNLQNRVLDLEYTKTTQALEIDSLKRRVKKLEKKHKSKTHLLKRLYKVGLSARVVSSEDEGLSEEDASKQGRKIHDIDADEDITLENVHDKDMFGVNDLDGDEVVIESEVANKDVNLSVDEVTLAQALTALKIVSSRPRAKGIVFHEQEQAPTPIVSSQQPSQIKVQDKGKGKMNEPEPVKNLSKNDQLRLNEELAFRLQAEEEEEEKRLAREKVQQIKEANTAWDDIQAKVEADYLLAQGLHDEEQEQYTDEEKAKFFCEFLDQRRKFFAAKRAKAKRNKPPTQAQQRNLAFKRVNTFVDHEKELIEESSKKGENEKVSSSKRTGEELESNKSKKQKLDEKVEAEVDDAKEAEELRQCLEIVPDDGDDVIVDVTPLSVKMPIVDYKIYQEGKKSFFQIIRADEPVNYIDTFLHLNLKTMFEHHLEDNVWKNQQGLVKVLNWKLYDSYGVHCVTMQNILYYLLVEKMYPLIKHTLHQIFNYVKLQVDYECEMAFELLRLVKKQFKEGYVPQ